MRIFSTLLILSLFISFTINADEPRDLMSDTWVATDALGRSLPIGGVDCPLPKKDRTAIIFYFLWHNPGIGGPYDLTKIVAENPIDPKYGPNQAFHHWAEPELGYYVQPDEFLYRRHVQLLSVAGVDVLSFDVTNRITYPEHYLGLLKTMEKIRSEGNKTQQITFLLNSSHVDCAKDLFSTIYSQNLHPDFWFHWQGKPLLMADPAGHGKEINDFFTFRRSWAWAESWFGDGRDRWPWLENYPQAYGWHKNPETPEQISVCVAQHPTSNKGRSFHQGKEPQPEERFLQLTAEGKCFAEQWKRALEVDPPVLFITGWNEWIAQRFLVEPGGHSWMMGKQLPVGGSFFVDLYDVEFNRDIEPMQGGTGDAFYYQMVAGLRQYKGARPIPEAGPSKTIKIDGRFDDWTDVQPEYRDASFDTVHRNSPSWNNGKPYVDQTGRNDIMTSKVSRDKDHLYFYLESREPIVLPSGENGLLLLIDADKDSKTGFNGYDFMAVVATPTKGAKITAVIVPLNADGTRGETEKIRVGVANNALEMSIPKKSLGLTKPKFEFDFHWIDNIDHRSPFDPTLGRLGEAVDCNGLGHPGFPRHGDSAPDRRFNYRYRF